MPSQGHLASFDQNGVTSTVSARLDKLGTGWYQVILLVGVGGATLAESIEMGAVAPLATALVRTCSWDDWVRRKLPWISHLGGAVGFALSGIMSDWGGRRFPIIVSLIGMAVVMYATGVVKESDGARYGMTLRFFASVFAMLQLPAGAALAAESCSTISRGRIIFALTFLSSFGYVMEAFGMMQFMPMFGEAETDDVKGFCVFIAACSIIALPFVLFLSESPCFLAVAGEKQRLTDTLKRIAWYNGVESQPRPVALPDPTLPLLPSPAREERQENQRSRLGALLELALDRRCLIILLLFVIESFKGFFISGSSYIMKDLFVLLHDQTHYSGATLNAVASLAPLVGLFVGSCVLWMGARRVYVGFACISGLCVYLLSQERFRLNPTYALPLIMTMKMGYGTLNACLTIFKVEAFPTEIRVTAFAIVSVGSRFACAYAPAMIEQLKGGHEAESWSSEALHMYFCLLMFSIVLSGLMALLLPDNVGSEGVAAPIRDYIKKTLRSKANTRRSLGPIPRDRKQNRLSYGTLPPLRLSVNATVPNLWDDDDDSGTSSDDSSLPQEAPRRTTPRSSPWTTLRTTPGAKPEDAANLVHRPT